MLGFHHFALEVTDIDKSIAFYIDKLGFKIHIPKTKVDKNPKTGVENLFYAYLQAESGSYLELIEFCDKKEKVTMHDILCPHIGLETNDFEATSEILKKNNVEISDGPHTIPGDVKILTILDPDGYRIDIGQLLKEKS